MIKIDGSYGEGGGQILRTALSLAMLTSKKVEIDNIRAGRKKPGLRPQHLASVRASVEISGGSVKGAQNGSQKVIFSPGSIKSDRYIFDIGTAGSTSLVLQTIFYPLSRATGVSEVMITGGTHVPWSPCFHYLDMHWFPYLSKMNFNASLSLEKAGFYPQGGGKIKATINPCSQVHPLSLVDRGQLLQIKGISAVSNLPRKIAERQRERVINRLGRKYYLNDIRIRVLPSRFKGTLLLLIAEFDHSQACFFGLGELKKPAEQVADDAIGALEDFLATDGTVDPYLADQLLIPMAMANSSSKLKTSRITQHLLTNAIIIQRFLPVDIYIDAAVGQPGLIVITV